MPTSTRNMNKPEATVSLVSLVLYFTCMKNSTTRVILVQAMASATTGFQNRVIPGAMCHSPRSINEAHTVSPVATSSDKKNHQINDRADNVMLVAFAVRVVFVVFAHAISPAGVLSLRG